LRLNVVNDSADFRRERALTLKGNTMKKLFLIALIFAANAHAEPCNDIEQKKTDDLVAEYPRDNIAVKLAALRTGLCHYVESKKITEDQAGEILEIEKQKMINEKFTINLKPIT
jgi:hypothetical protein